MSSLIRALPLVVIVFGAFCSPDAAAQHSRRPQWHATVLLDLSVHLTELHRVEKDKVVIDEIARVFAEEVRRKLFVTSRDRLFIVLADQGTNPDAFGYLDELAGDLANIPMAKRSRCIEGCIEGLLSGVGRLYEDGASAESFSGADIWEYFAEDLQVPSQDEAGETVRNLLVVLTDGYLIATDNLYREGNQANHIPAETLRRLRNRSDWMAGQRSLVRQFFAHETR